MKNDNNVLFGEIIDRKCLLWAINAGITAAKGGGTSDIVRSFLIGTMTSAIGGAAGGIVSPGIGGGFSAGFNAGAINGASSGFFASFGGSILNGGNIGDAFSNGVKGGLLGAGTGALIGGLREGIDAKNNGGRFSDGSGYTMDQEYSDSAASIGGKRDFTNKSISKFVTDNSELSRVSDGTQMFADGSVPIAVIQQVNCQGLKLIDLLHLFYAFP
jgi:hypothetical protein